MQQKVMGVIGIIAGLGIVVRNLSGGSASGGIGIVGAIFGTVMLGAGIYAIVKKPKPKE